MKLIFILTVLIVSFLIYQLFYGKSFHSDSNRSIAINDVVTPKQEQPAHRFEPLPIEEKLQELPDTPAHKAQKSMPKEDIIKDYLTLEDIKRELKKKREKEPQIEYTSYQKEIFLQIKQLLQQSSHTYYTKHSIVLNSYMRSILPTRESREKFKTLFIQHFGYDEATVEAAFKKYNTVWDWVNFVANK